MILLVILLAFASVGIAAEGKSVNFVTDKEKDGGYLAEITIAAFKKMGYQVNIKYVPWARALKTVMGGTEEALLGCFYTDERANKMLYTNSFGASEQVLFKLRDSTANVSTLDDLKPYRVGIIRFGAYTPEFEAATFIHKETVTHPEQNLEKLLAGRIDLVLENRRVVFMLLKTQFSTYASKIVALEPPFIVNKFYNAFSKNIPGYEKKVADFNAGLNLIMKDGTFKKIMDKGLHE